MSLHFKNTLHQSFHHNQLLGEQLKNLLANSKDKVPLPKDIFRKLAQLKLLQGIPFHYLVPHPQMLPKESIKFFHLDPNWVNALVDGAYNIGRYAAKEEEEHIKNTSFLSSKLDKAFVEDIHSSSNQSAHLYRAHMLKIVDDPAQLSAAQTAGEQVVISGFLLRSKVVDQWRDLQVDAYPDKASAPKADSTADVKTNPIFRFEWLGNEVLLVLFVGDFYQVDIHQAPQGIHFGFDKRGDELVKVLRKTHVNKKDNTVEEIPFRGDRSMNVVDMSKLSEKMAGAMSDLPDYCKKLPTPRLLASDFALQMVEGVGMVRFIRAEKEAIKIH
ncbi:MAG: hypothetical protein AAFP19_11385 [Bacteroidota bacterium]